MLNVSLLLPKISKAVWSELRPALLGAPCAGKIDRTSYLALVAAPSLRCTDVILGRVHQSTIFTLSAYTVYAEEKKKQKTFTQVHEKRNGATTKETSIEPPVPGTPSRASSSQGRMNPTWLRGKNQ